MSLPHGWQNELQGLLDRLQDGGFTEQDRSRLNDLLHAGPEPQDFFITYLEIDSGLTWDGRLASDGGQPSLGGDELPPDLSVHVPQRTDGLSSSTAPRLTVAFPRFVRCRFPAFPWRRTAFLPDRGDLPGTGILAASRGTCSDPRQAGPRQQAANPCRAVVAKSRRLAGRTDCAGDRRGRLPMGRSEDGDPAWAPRPVGLEVCDQLGAARGDVPDGQRASSSRAPPRIRPTATTAGFFGPAN